MATATIVVSLPSLKPLITRISPTNTSNSNNSGYINAVWSLSRPEPSRSYAQATRASDDEVELVHREEASRNSPIDLTRAVHTNAIGSEDYKEVVVRVTTNTFATVDAL
jgi:peptidoglycan hydrolase-like amidase